jgi:glutaminase
VISVYKSELEVGYGNKAAINFMMNKGCFEKSMSDSELADILDLYYQLCSLEVTVKTQSIMGACFANGGVNPLNFKRIIPEKSNVRTMSLMFSSGMYDYSGKFAFNYGVPAKSGVSGATMVVIPNVLAITLYNPWLGQESASSVRALEFISRFNEKYPFHMFDNSKIFSGEHEFDAQSSLTFFNS